VRFVLDTNVVISALLWRGTPYRLLEAIRLRDTIALAASADLIVSGDPDQLVLKVYERIPIVTPAAALRQVQTPT
jgi:predicted nucleic acid-binding protein